jgi:diguanylate cyclase (GGDEF)-like protein/PAS domain S-box-containing protein
MSGVFFSGNDTSSQAAEMKPINKQVEKESAKPANREDKALRDSEMRYRRLFETTQDGILVLDGDTGEITDVNPFLVKMLGYSHEEFLGKKLWEIGPFKDIEASRTAYQELQKNDFIRYEDLPLQSKDGQRMDVEFISNVYLAGSQRVIQCNIRDITGRVRAEEKLRESNFHDILTGLYNRCFFEEEVARLERGREFPISIVMADVDSLKLTNDRQGHAAGDELLKRVAQIFTAAFRIEDIIARIGGDEFAVLLPNTDAKTAEEALRRVRHILQEHNAVHEESPLRLSFGVSTAGKHTPLADVLDEADENMYREKRSHDASR